MENITADVANVIKMVYFVFFKGLSTSVCALSCWMQTKHVGLLAGKYCVLTY
jgi:hypothetical protein